MQNREEFGVLGTIQKEDSEAERWKSNPKGQFMREDYKSASFTKTDQMKYWQVESSNDQAGTIKTRLENLLM